MPHAWTGLRVSFAPVGLRSALRRTDEIGSIVKLPATTGGYERRRASPRRITRSLGLMRTLVPTRLVRFG
jgi:hypothetical protein